MKQSAIYRGVRLLLQLLLLLLAKAARVYPLRSVADRTVLYSPQGTGGQPDDWTYDLITERELAPVVQGETMDLALILTRCSNLLGLPVR